MNDTDMIMSGLPANETDSIKIIAQDMKNLVKRIQDLRHLGIEDSKIALPKICVVGDQSTGKSSLIEGMSEIKVPRSAGTCTRCPMEINLTESQDQEWKCHIYLSRKFMFDGSRKVTKIPKKSQPLGPWIPQEQEDELFITLNNKDDVQEALKWAQIAILNPGRASTDYIPSQDIPGQSVSEECQVKFSPNVVRLDISSPNFPNLSFYDLPGVISQAERDDERYLVSLVENLVKEYISHDNCIVLLTLPMTDDATNSSAARIIGENKNSAKRRTLGVLTKPDRIQTGESFSQWTGILEGEKFKLGHGYYVVRNNPDPTIEHAQAREEEAEFFASSPWSTELCCYQDKFGTRRLQTALSNLLLEQIQGCLPRIVEQIEEKAQRIDAELQTLPGPPSENVQFVLCKKINRLEEQIRASIDGGSSQYPLQKIWGHIASDFKRALVKTRPTVQLLSRSDTFVFRADRDEDSDCEMTSAQPTAPARGQTPATAARQSPSVQQPPETKPSGYSTTHFERFNAPAKMFTWDEIKEINEDSYRAGLPDLTDPKAIEIMNQHSVKHWDEPMVTFLNATHKLVRDMLLRQLEEVFTEYYQTSLYRELKRIIDVNLQSIRKDHFGHAQENYNIEYNKPFTMATSALEEATKVNHDKISASRLGARARRYLQLQAKYSDGDARFEIERKKLTSTELGADKFAQEVKMMATTRGYYDVASSRFVDSICQGVHTKLFSKCREELGNVIEKELGIFENNGSAVDRCLELMAEDPERQKRRQFLLREKEKISKAQQWLATVKKEDDSGYSNIDTMIKAE
ncbi:hypothetical protein AWENTII_011479 [Aspergillus wentii]|nr:hypothetical protein MW887_003941 [Aspergillus wentii]